MARWYSTRLFRFLLALAISVVILYFLFSKVSIAETWQALTGIDPWFLLIGFVLYILTTFLKGVRWKQVLKGKVSLRESFNIMNVNLMFNNILPFKTGELSMLFLLRKKGVKYRDSLAYLIVLRLFDLFALLILFFSGILLLKASFGLPFGFFIAVIIFFVIIAGLLVMSIYWHKKAIGIAEQIFAGLRLAKKRFAKTFLKKARLVSEELNHLKGLSVSLFLISLITWFLGVVSVQVLLQGMGISFPLEKMLLAITLQVILSNLPIQGLAGFGTYEGFWAVSFILLGMDKKTAVLTGLSTHVILLAMSILLGVIGLFFVLRSPPRRSNHKIY